MNIDIRDDGRLLVMKIKEATFGEAEVRSAFGAVKEKMDRSSLVVFDFLDVKTVTEEAILLLNMFASSTEHRKARTVFLVKDSLHQKMKINGFSDDFLCYQDMTTATKSRSLELHHEAIDFLNFVREATFNVLSIAAKCKAQAGAMYKRGDGPTPKIDIAGIVGIFDTTYQGTIVIGFEMKAYLEIIGRLHNRRYEKLLPEICDGAAELLNMIVHRAKTSYGVRGAPVEQSLSTVVMGTDLRVFIEKTPSMIVPVQTEVGNLFIEIATVLPNINVTVQK